MVIGFDGSRAFLKSKSGTENYSHNLLLNLAKIDIENKYLVYVRAGIKVNVNVWPKNFQFKQISLKRLWTQVGLGLQTFLDGLDLLFIPAHTLPIIHKPGLKTILTVHDLGAEYLPKMHQLKQRLYLKFMTNYQLKSASKIIAVSMATQADLIEKVGIKPKKISVIYEGVDRNIFKPIKNDHLISILNKYDLFKNNYFLFVGTIQPRKNLNRLIEAYSFLVKQSYSLAGQDLRLKNVDSRIHKSSIVNRKSLKLVLVGDKGWMSDDIYLLPKELGIDDKVKFLGRVETKDLVGLYNGAIGLVYPSLFEGFGLPILEAFACNLPVLTSNVSSMPEIAGNAAKLVDPYSVESIAEDLKFLLISKNRVDLIKRGKLRLNKFSWEKTAQETLKVFKEVYGHS